MAPSPSELFPTKPTVPGAIPFETGGSGIYSTLGDYLKIINVLINGGKGGNGARILKEDTVTMMLQDQIAHLEGTMEVPIPAPNAELVYGPIHMLPGVSKGWVCPLPSRSTSTRRGLTIEGTYIHDHQGPPTDGSISRIRLVVRTR